MAEQPNKIGLEWLQKIFKSYIYASCTVGRYHLLLILDGHGSHTTAEFGKFCTEREIIPIYMPHSFHLLQPLDVSCFSPLKYFYGQHTKIMQQQGVHTLRRGFLHIYPMVHPRALSSVNIQVALQQLAWFHLSPKRVLSKLQIQLKTPTPPSTAHSNHSFGAGKTLADIQELEKQKK